MDQIQREDYDSETILGALNEIVSFNKTFMNNLENVLEEDPSNQVAQGSYATARQTIELIEEVLNKD